MNKANGEWRMVQGKRYRVNGTGGRVKSLCTLITFCLWGLGSILSAQPPAGYYDAAFGKKKEALKTAMMGIIRPHSERTYAQLWTDFQQTDQLPDGKVWDMYSDIPDGMAKYYFTFTDDQCGNYGKEGDCYNREHSFPKSWFNDATPMYTDLFHIYPTDGYVNNRRGNDAFGEVASVRWTSTNGSKVGTGNAALGYTSEVFEPRDDFKGDFARTYFYMVTCYEDLLSGWNCDMIDNSSYPALKTWALNLLLKWSRNDKVSQKEIDRNNAVYEIQGNRNPFIDYPQLAEYIWGDSVAYVFNPNSAVSIPNVYDDETNQPIVYAASGVLYVANAHAGATIQIYDIMGRQLFQQSNISGLFSTKLPDNRFFIVKITGKSGQTSVHRVVRY